MSRVFIEGFETGSLNLWDAVSGDVTLHSPGMYNTGVYYLATGGASGDFVQKYIPAKNECYFSFKYAPMEILSGYPTVSITFYSGTGRQLCFAVWPNWSVWLGNRQLLSSGQIAVVGQSYKLEGYVKIDSNAGRALLKVDGITQVDYTGNTDLQASGTIDSFRLGANGFTNSLSEGHFDDVVIDDSEFPGESWIQGIVPDGNGDVIQWSPSDSPGDNWDMVNEIPPSDYDYVYTNQIDMLDLYTFTNLSGVFYNIKSIQAHALTKIEGDATPKNLKIALRIGMTDYFSQPIQVPSAWKSLYGLWQENPATNLPWTEDDINSLQAGMKSAE